MRTEHLLHVIELIDTHETNHKRGVSIHLNLSRREPLPRKKIIFLMQIRDEKAPINEMPRSDACKATSRFP